MFECNTPSALGAGMSCVQRLCELDPGYVFSLAHAGTLAPKNWFVPEKLFEELKSMVSPVDIFARLSDSVR